MGEDVLEPSEYLNSTHKPSRHTALMESRSLCQMETITIFWKGKFWVVEALQGLLDELNEVDTGGRSCKATNVFIIGHEASHVSEQ